MHVDEDFQQLPDRSNAVTGVARVCFSAELRNASDLACVGQAQRRILFDEPRDSQRGKKQRDAVSIEL